jgi:perosamine synthetase|tara:strand:+ start:3228 stop:4559 length:1332 start_codon:yes stop_codon:yes gene_type:complete
MFKYLGKKLIQIVNSVILLSRSPYFGFINGHSYLSKSELNQILDLITNPKSDDEKLTLKFETNFAKLIGDGKSISFAAGRMAFYAYMKSLKIGNDDEIIIQSSNCSVMVNAILRIGAKPIFADIDINTMGTDPKSVRKLITSKTKLIVAQHSFGIPCEIDEIVKIGNKYNIKVLEDCALTVGSKYKGLTVGNWGDAALFSIDHSKPLNCMVGGLLYFNNDKLYWQIKKSRDKMPDLSKKHQIALYKQILFERKYYSPEKYSLGKFIELFFAFFSKLRKHQTVFLTDDYNHPNKLQITNYSYPARLPVFISQLGLYELQYFKKNKVTRIQLLDDYIKIFKNNNKSHLLPNAYFDKRNEIIPLRFFAYFSNKLEVYKYFSKVFDSQSSWFQKPIIGCDDIEDMGYITGSCINSEILSKKIINFPCTFDVKYKKDIQNKTNSFLSK